LNYSDPGVWENCDDHLRRNLVNHGPVQVVDFNFPKNNNQRKFSIIHYKRRLINGENVHRQWLQYSISKDSVFCFSCKLFSTTNKESALCNKGSNDWKNMSAILANHEKSSDHLASFQAWKELELRLKKNKTVDENNLRLIRQEEKYWQQILERLIALIQVLGAQNLALRGTNEQLFTAGNGNFLKFVEYLALFDPIMHEHLRKVSNKEIHVHYLGKDIQNEIINILSAAVREKILASANAAKYFALILDCTPDVSHVEQMTIIIRFVDMTNANKCEIKEHFLGFVPLIEKTGISMTEQILEKLKEMKLPIANLRGQGYDNGSNMKGKNNGVQRKILDINPRAFFVPCNSHSLNLVINDAAKCCLNAISFFNLIQSIYTYFSSSTQRWTVLLCNVSNLTLKPLSDTRWESRIDALKPLRYQLGSIHNALMDIFEDTTLTGSSGNLSRIEAKGLAKKISNFNFIVSLIIWHNILFEINLTSKLLQSKDFDLHAATKQLHVTKTFLENCRSDLGFEKMLVEAKELAEELNIPAVFESVSEPTRLGKKRNQFSYEAKDEPILNAKQRFKINFYFAILDTAINSIDERFSQLEQINSVFGFLYNLQKLENESHDNILKNCLNLEKCLTHGDSKDIDASELCSELQAIARRVPKNAKPQDVINYIYNYNLLDSMPNLIIALRILLTLPISVATGERSFSKLKLIKTYIRSTMTQDRLVGLSTLSIEQDIAQTIDLNELVSTFSKLKVRKIKM